MTERQAKSKTLTRFIFFEFRERLYRLQAGNLKVWSKMLRKWVGCNRLRTSIANIGREVDVDSAQRLIFGDHED